MDWQKRIDRPGAPAVPIVCSRMHRVFWVPRRYRGLIAAALDGKAFTIRAIAERSGYSRNGAHAAFASLAEMGIGTTKAVRGRLGRTVFRLSDDASTVNVPTTVTPSMEVTSTPSLRERTVDGTFSLTRSEIGFYGLATGPR